MKVELDEDMLKILEFWILSCSDHSLDYWGEFCNNKCPVKDKCKKLKELLGI